MEKDRGSTARDEEAIEETSLATCVQEGGGNTPKTKSQREKEGTGKDAEKIEPTRPGPLPGTPVGGIERTGSGQAVQSSTRGRGCCHGLNFSPGPPTRKRISDTAPSGTYVFDDFRGRNETYMRTTKLGHLRM